MNDEGPGLEVAVNALQAMREWLHAYQLTAHFHLGDDELNMVVDEDGHKLYVDGRAVPMRQQG